MGSVEAETEQERGVPCQVRGDCFSLRSFIGGNGVGPCLFELEVGPILLTLLAEALGARGEEGRDTSPTGPDVA